MVQSHYTFVEQMNTFHTFNWIRMWFSGHVDSLWHSYTSLQKIYRVDSAFKLGGCGCNSAPSFHGLA